ncbi:hypothetical protein LSH36_154g01059 [Paralvinella palmiformis]|uniref:N-terminal methionine N(alpha)-acetyltransferase NatC n=1 Tax=Paralvinella palmiformis TaxID=53620 RepID=A0AAD9JVQ9_9ANNE|nr:hypothetical protein LSH36_154g01059 [Paralvinella palmiformis]
MAEGIREAKTFGTCSLTDDRSDKSPAEFDDVLSSHGYPFSSSLNHSGERQVNNANKSDGMRAPFSKNGIVFHGKNKEGRHKRVTDASDKTDTSRHTYTRTINLSDSLTQENTRKQVDVDAECVDSGVHSGAENGSDGKSSSSSPGLSTESSANDLCDKAGKKYMPDVELVKTSNVCDNLAPADGDVERLAEQVSESISLSKSDGAGSSEKDIKEGIEYVVYESELQMPEIMRLITKDLSEPYSIYTYRYFIHNWPKLCFLAMDGSHCVGAIVCKLDMHKKMIRRGYIAMLAVDEECRRKGIGSHLVLKAIAAMMSDDCDEVVLETEITNKAALRLYENLGFVRDKRLFRYYLNGVDALRLKLWLR